MQSRLTLFLSHHPADAAWSAPFAAALQQAGCDVWDDQALEEPGWDELVLEEIAQREFFVVIVSAQAARSARLRRHLEQALLTRRKVVPVLSQMAPLTALLGMLPCIQATGIESQMAAYHLLARLPDWPALPEASAWPFGDLPGEPAEVPYELWGLGFHARSLSGTTFLVPPLCFVPAGPVRLYPSALFPPDPPERVAFPLPLAGYLGQYPVTGAEYACAVQAGVVREPPAGTPWGTIGQARLRWAEQRQHPHHPVVNVSWRDAVRYTLWLRDLTGVAWQLPTVQHWTKAARGTEDWDYPWGNEPPTQQQEHLFPFPPPAGPYAAWSPEQSVPTQEQGTFPIGTHPATMSPFGLHDLVGSVRQWTGSLHPWDRRKALAYPDTERALSQIVSGRMEICGGLLIRFETIDYRSDAELDAYFPDLGFRLMVPVFTSELGPAAASR
jgi:formylglycine-generating enzyme required for sulfatase activity